MADFHALKASDTGDMIKIVAHFPVPIGTNLAGFTYAQALAADPDVDTVSVVSNITAAEQADLDSGVLFERQYQFKTHEHISTANKQAALDALYPVNLVKEQNRLIQRYKFYGFARTVT